MMMEFEVTYKINSWFIMATVSVYRCVHEYNAGLYSCNTIGLLLCSYLQNQWSTCDQYIPTLTDVQLWIIFLTIPWSLEWVLIFIYTLDTTFNC